MRRERFLCTLDTCFQPPGDYDPSLRSHGIGVVNIKCGKYQDYNGVH